MITKICSANLKILTNLFYCIHKYAGNTIGVTQTFVKGRQTETQSFFTQRILCAHVRRIVIPALLKEQRTQCIINWFKCYLVALAFSLVNADVKATMEFGGRCVNVYIVTGISVKTESIWFIIERNWFPFVGLTRWDVPIGLFVPRDLRNMYDHLRLDALPSPLAAVPMLCSLCQKRAKQQINIIIKL